MIVDADRAENLRQPPLPLLAPFVPSCESPRLFCDRTHGRSASLSVVEKKSGPGRGEISPKCHKIPLTGVSA